MKIIISRTSIDDKKPCKEAKKGLFPCWDTRSCSEEYFNNSFTESWRSRGKNHTKVGKYITRQLEDIEKWYIEIETLDDLIKLQKKYGDLIIKSYLFDKYKGKDNILEIEIYDDYRE